MQNIRWSCFSSFHHHVLLLIFNYHNEERNCNAPKKYRIANPFSFFEFGVVLGTGRKDDLARLTPLWEARSVRSWRDFDDQEHDPLRRFAYGKHYAQPHPKPSVFHIGGFARLPFVPPALMQGPHIDIAEMNRHGETSPWKSQVPLVQSKQLNKNFPENGWGNMCWKPSVFAWWKGWKTMTSYQIS